MKIIADLAKGLLTFNGRVFNVSCRVRTVREGTRAGNQVTRSIPDNLPYDPRPFPKGLWRVTAVEWRKDKGFDKNIYGVVKIRTDAWQNVNVWELDEDGDYLKETERRVKDSGYLLHYSTSNTTLGCIRLASNEDAENLAVFIEGVLESGEPVLLEVV